jgi:hypothetical protein
MLLQSNAVLTEEGIKSDFKKKYTESFCTALKFTLNAN